MTKPAAKILVVDDYAPNRAAYVGWLGEIEGVEALGTDRGRQALELARKYDFAMFVLDINMPDMDGFELASLLRQEPRSAHTPIVFVSSEAHSKTYLLRGYRMGAVDVLLSGPLDGEILQQKARVFIQLYSKRIDLQRTLEQVGRENRELHARLEEFIRQQETLREQATLDGLTKLPNRTLFHDRLDAAVRRAQRSRQRFALAYVDLDGFKAVNDRHGHAVGDALIVATAQRLSRSVRATDTVARLGGDEFAVLFEGLDSPAGAGYVAEKVHCVLCEPVMLQVADNQPEIEVRAGASIGVALYPDHAGDKSDLMMLADMTMYAVKRAGGGARVYSGHIGDEREPGPSLQVVRPRKP